MARARCCRSGPAWRTPQRAGGRRLVVKALQFDRKIGRFAAAKVARRRAARRRRPRRPAASWPTSTRPSCPGPAGCGSGHGWPASAARDLSTIDGAASRYFEPIVSFPFVPGHEVVADTDDDQRVVLEPVLGCVTRGIVPAVRGLRPGRPRRLRAPRLRSPLARPPDRLLLRHRRWLEHVHGRPREPAPRRARRR